MLDILEAARLRPGMFIGSTDAYGMQFLPRCLIDNAIDAYLAGNGGTISVAMHRDGGIRVRSDAIILPISPTNGVSESLRDMFLRPVVVEKEQNDLPSDVVRPSFTDLGNDYRVSGDFRYGGELCLVNALSRSLTAEICHDGRCWRQEFRDQRSVDASVSASLTAETATIVTIYPDDTIFAGAQFRWEDTYQYLRQSSYLVPGLALRLVDARQSPTGVYEFPPTNSVTQYVLDLTTGQWPFCLPIRVVGDDGRIKVHIALQYADGPGVILSFANNHHTRHHGAHVAGFLAALKHVLKEVGAQNGMLDGRVLRQSDMTAHMTAVVSVWAPRPLFRRATRSELYNPEVRKRVFEVTSKSLLRYFEDNADDARWILAQLPRREQ